MNWRIGGSILLYGLCLGGLSAVMYWGRYRFTVLDANAELYTLLIALIFAALGAWLGIRLTKPKTIVRKEIVIREVPVSYPAPATAVAPVNSTGGDLGISQRELDVLQLLARGMSNDEIARELFVSANTVKTHLSNLYFKLDVKRRTQAVDRARQLGLIG